MIRWRQLFDHLGIEWKDRGSNCSRGHVNIPCPQCGRNDPSYHLTISEETGEYYCYRSPHHSGRSLPWLLICLQVTPSEIDGLISEFSDDQYVARSAPRQKRVDWAKFESAADSQICLDYLASRGFDNPRSICLQYDLRFTKYGDNAWRLLFPLTTLTDTVGLTGRALRSHQKPRYLTNDPYGSSIYQPRMSGRILLLCEGPFDALAAAVAGTDVSIATTAILGTSLPVERRMHLAKLAREAIRVIYVPDGDQSRADTYRLVEELEGTPGIDKVAVLSLPGFKDIAEFYQQNRMGAVEWISRIGSSQHGKDLSSKLMPQNT